MSTWTCAQSMCEFTVLVRMLGLVKRGSEENNVLLSWAVVKASCVLWSRGHFDKQMEKWSHASRKHSFTSSANGKSLENTHMGEYRSFCASCLAALQALQQHMNVNMSHRVIEL
ncbi:uncharacterized protein LOC129253304 [Anastrepha obliqua]|uniref:uncharacterized protein LOC129253304 n=1 Tax=Anastrepha obliqua TaxID=95512 RepID=UPI002409B2F2|nr:uncharacterized protein LOC129253304 [Anastrepha obliqua]